jgi:cell division protein FtsQ
MGLKVNKENYSQKRSFRNLSRKIMFIVISLSILIATKLFMYDRESINDFFYSHINKASAKFGFLINNVTVESSNLYCPTVKADIFDSYKSESIFLIPIRKIQEYIESIDCIESANISRHLPSEIKIKIINKEPIAIWQHKKNFFFINKDNSLMRIRNSKNLMDFIIVTGEQAFKHTQNLIQIISVDQDIFEKVDAAMRVGNRRWDIKLINGLVVKLPEKNPELAWKKFLNIQKDNQIQKKINVVDLRVANKTYIK